MLQILLLYWRQLKTLIWSIYDRCILIVDDDEDTLRLLQMIARTAAIDVCIARSASKRCHCYRQAHIAH
jgi:DNA-binding NtrC family response regulator